MAEATNELIVEILRRVQADVSDVKVDMRELRSRVGIIERQIADLSVRMDRRDEMMEPVMRRLELGETSH
jgi:hypothetical protein